MLNDLYKEILLRLIHLGLLFGSFGFLVFSEYQVAEVLAILFVGISIYRKKGK